MYLIMKSRSPVPFFTVSEPYAVCDSLKEAKAEVKRLNKAAIRYDYFYKKVRKI